MRAAFFPVGSLETLGSLHLRASSTADGLFELPAQTFDSSHGVDLNIYTSTYAGAYFHRQHSSKTQRRCA